MFRRSITLLAAIAPARALRVPISSNALSRRAFAGTALSTALAGVAVAPSPAFAASDGKWAQRYDEFTDADFEDFKTAPSGLKYKIIEEGYGVKPLAGQKIKAHYSGYLLNGAKFDSSYDRRKPLEFQVGVGRVIKGWDEALLDMKVGEQRILKIPYARHSAALNACMWLHC